MEVVRCRKVKFVWCDEPSRKFELECQKCHSLVDWAEARKSTLFASVDLLWQLDLGAPKSAR